MYYIPELRYFKNQPNVMQTSPVLIIAVQEWMYVISEECDGKND
jgi:hypothetical protein